MNIINRKAKFDYEFLDEYVAGLVLKGSEVKPLRGGDANLKDSHCYFKEGELYSDFHISEYKGSSYNNHDTKRPKKLLLTKKQLIKLKKQITEKGLTIIPYKLFLDKALIKIIIKVARGKKNYEKRFNINKKTAAKEIKNLTGFNI